MIGHCTKPRHGAIRVWMANDLEWPCHILHGFMLHQDVWDLVLNALNFIPCLTGFPSFPMQYLIRKANNVPLGLKVESTNQPKAVALPSDYILKNFHRVQLLNWRKLQLMSSKKIF